MFVVCCVCVCVRVRLLLRNLIQDKFGDPEVKTTVKADACTCTCACAIFNGFTGRVEEMYVVHRIDHICHGLWRCPEFIPLIDRWEGG